MYSLLFVKKIVVNSNVIMIKRMASSSKFIKILEEKDLLKDWLPQNKKEEMVKLFNEEQTLYAGFDPTGPSLHVGNLLVIMTLLHAIRNGHRVICLIGDATAQIGDPSGKETKREQLKEEEIKANAARISSTISSIFANHLKYFWKPKSNKSIHEPIIVHNSSWYQDIGLLEFLKDTGSHIKVRNLSRKSFVEDRAQNLSFSQFTYQVIQGYDWLKLFDRYDCRIQIGGVDQTHNIEAGYTLIRNMREKEAFGMFVPLLMDKDGKKMGKTEGKSLFLDRFINSPYNFYKSILRLPHGQMRKFLQYFTFYNQDEIEWIIQKDLRKPSLIAQEKLAETLTLLIHGEVGLNQGKNAAKALLNNEFDALGKLTEDDLVEVFGQDKFIVSELEPSITTLLDVIMKTGCFEEQDLAITMIRKGGIQLNNRKVTDPGYQLDFNDVLPNNLTVIQIGLKRACLVRWL